jgi:alanyl-tRNA synthetase
MSEEIKTNQVEENNENNPSTDASKNNDIPYSRFQEVNTAKKEAESKMLEMQEKLDAIDAENKAKREERLKKNEEYTTLIAEKDAEIDKYKGTANKWNEYETNRRDVLISKLPENKQKFVSSMSLTDLEEFVDIETANANKGTGMDSSRAGAKPTNDFGGYSSIEEFAAKDPKGCDEYLNKNVQGYQWGKVR